MRRPLLGIFALAAMAACTVPTEMPNWDVTWSLPLPIEDGEGLTIGVSSFLPTGVTVETPAGGGAPTAFVATVGNPPAISRTLGSDCGSCAALNGTNAPKPAFTAAPPATTVNLAAGSSLASATLATGSQVVFSITNGFNFDPIRPQAGSATTGTGSVTLTVTNGTTTLGTLTINGTTSAIPGNGATTNFTLPLSGTINGAQPISVTMTMNSPAGSNVVINTSQVFSVAATPTIKISSASVTLAAQSVTSSVQEMDLSGIDSSIVKRITNDNQNRGAILMTVTNPFTVATNATFTFRSPTGTPASQAITPINKAVSIPAAPNATTPATGISVVLPFTGVELRRILGREIEIVVGGTTSAGTVTVTPASKITAVTRVDINFNIKEQE